MAVAAGSLFDTHCHLDAAEFEHDRAAVLAEALAAGVDAMLVPAVEVANFAAVKTLCAATWPADLPATGVFVVPAAPAAPPGDAVHSQKISLYATYGIHPMYTPQAREHDIVTLRRWLADEQPQAVGEIGLDGFVPGLDMARQQWFFVEQLKLARDFDLPVVLHSRRAVDLVLKQLRRIGVRGGIAHAFNGSRQQADAFIKLGFKLGFGGAMTFTGSTRIRALATELPLDSLVLETDSPDIPPAWLAGGRNTPAQLAAILGVLATLRGEDPEMLAIACKNNALEALSVKIDPKRK